MTTSNNWLQTFIITYFKSIEGNVLDKSVENICSISLEAQSNYLIESGEKVEDMSDEAILRANTGSHVFLKATVHFVDAMEDLTMEVNM